MNREAPKSTGQDGLTRVSIQQAIQEITGKAPTPEQLLIKGISDRLTHGMNEIDAMRVDTYLMDILQVVKSGSGVAEENLFRIIKLGHAYTNLNSVMEVPDLTTITLMQEVQGKLAGIGKDQDSKETNK